MGYLHDESKQENGYRLSGMSSQDSCWHLRWLETELTLTGERRAVNVARSVRRGLAGKAGNAARWLATLQKPQSGQPVKTKYTFSEAEYYCRMPHQSLNLRR